MLWAYSSKAPGKFRAYLDRLLFHFTRPLSLKLNFDLASLLPEICLQSGGLYFFFSQTCENHRAKVKRGLDFP
jgi:hypothetical protein